MSTASEPANNNYGLPFITDLLESETVPESLVSRGYALVNLATETALIYSTFYSLSKRFFTQSTANKQQFSQIHFEETNKSPNSLHGYSKVAGNKEQFMLRYVNSTATESLKSVKTPALISLANQDDEKHLQSVVASSSHDDFGVCGLVLFEKFDTLCRSIANDVLTLFNKPHSIVADILDPIQTRDGVVTRSGAAAEHCFGVYTPNGYMSSSIMDSYHYWAQKQRGVYGHGAHHDSGLLTLIPVTDAPSLEVRDQKENCWIPIEELVLQYMRAQQQQSCQYAVVMLAESVHPYINRHISNVDHVLKPCFYRIDNGDQERFSVVYKQRTAPLRSHPRYQEDFYLAKLHSEIDQKSVHANLMKGKDKTNDDRNYKYYEYNTSQKSRLGVFCVGVAIFALYVLKKRGVVDISVKLNL